MRRILFGGLSLALGAFASPAAGQDTRTNPPPQRVARLGQPIAIPSTPAADSGVTPAGLLRRDPAPAAIPSPMPPPAAMPPMSSDSAPGTVTGIPTVTEDRSGTALGYPAVVPGMTFPGATIPPGTTIAPGSPTVVPSVAPDGSMVVPPGMEVPSFPDCGMGGPCPPGAPAMGRVASCGKWAFSGEYLMWWTRAANLPPLVTTSSPQFNGILGTGNTTTLVGGPFGETFHSGVRVSGVRWFGDDERNGLEGRMFFLGQASSSFTATTGEYPLLARPFFNTNQPVGQFSEVVGRCW